jgi:hypothetical protein
MADEEKKDDERLTKAQQKKLDAEATQRRRTVTAQRRWITKAELALFLDTPLRVEQLFSNPGTMIRGIRRSGVRYLRSRIQIRWDADSVIVVFEKRDDVPEGMASIYTFLESNYADRTEWIDAMELPKRKFYYLDGYHRMAAVTQINLERTGPWEGYLGEDADREDAGIYSPIFVIPRCRVYDIDGSNGGVNPLELTSWLNSHEENVTSTMLDKISISRLHVPYVYLRVMLIAHLCVLLYRAFMQSDDFRPGKAASGISIRAYARYLAMRPGICQILPSQAGREQFLRAALTIGDATMAYMVEKVRDEENPDSIWSITPIM